MPIEPMHTEPLAALVRTHDLADRMRTTLVEATKPEWQPTADELAPWWEVRSQALVAVQQLRPTQDHDGPEQARGAAKRAIADLNAVHRVLTAGDLPHEGRLSTAQEAVVHRAVQHVGRAMGHVQDAFELGLHPSADDRVVVGQARLREQQKLREEPTQMERLGSMVAKLTTVPKPLPVTHDDRAALLDGRADAVEAVLQAVPADLREDHRATFRVGGSTAEFERTWAEVRTSLEGDAERMRREARHSRQLQGKPTLTDDQRILGALGASAATLASAQSFLAAITG